MSGIFIIEGMSLRVLKLRIGVDEAGKAFVETPPEIAVAYDACVAWAKIALAHRDRAKDAMVKRRSVWASYSSADEKGVVLEEEFSATMQALVAAATCIDAFYDQIAPYSPTPPAIKSAWVRNKTARHKQISETIRATFRIRADEMKKASEMVRALYLLRDASVHPSSTPRLPYKHPELDIATDWRLTTFRGDVADMLVCTALGMLFDISRGTKFRSEPLTHFVRDLRSKIDRLLPGGKPTPEVPTVTFDIPPRKASRAEAP